MSIQPHETLTEIWVSCVPEDAEAASIFTIAIAYKGRGRWAVRRDGEYGRYLDADGNWSYRFGWDHEPATAEERAQFEAEWNAWWAAHTFDLDTARSLAHAAAPHLTYRGVTVADVLADYPNSPQKETPDVH